MFIIDVVCVIVEIVFVLLVGLLVCIIEEVELVVFWFEEFGVWLVDVIGEWFWFVYCWMDIDDFVVWVVVLYYLGYNESDEIDS